MFYSLRGKLLHIEPKLAVIECGGVGFRCAVTAHTARQLPKIGDDVMLYTTLVVREDALELFGFADLSEQRCFAHLTSVSGVGPKVGLAILSELSPESVALSVVAGDFKSLTRVTGVGPKLAQRIVLELKDKFGGIAVPDGLKTSSAGPLSAAGNAAQAVSALAVLGFTASEAALAVGKLDSGLPVNELVRQALKALGRK
ncbi:MAG: Holliday junction branch migration protein RuvA [Oscillospiraceae bacterium]|nr:Holliday junction branch migration protein RuvA [Oscillospiraceae bacterium]